MMWVLTAHAARYHKHYHSSGHVWQGRFRSFPIQEDEHLLAVLRYTERNALRARLVRRAETGPGQAGAAHGTDARPRSGAGATAEPLAGTGQRAANRSGAGAFASERWPRPALRRAWLDATCRPAVGAGSEYASAGPTTQAAGRRRVTKARRLNNDHVPFMGHGCPPRFSAWSRPACSTPRASAGSPSKRTWPPPSSRRRKATTRTRSSSTDGSSSSTPSARSPSTRDGRRGRHEDVKGEAEVVPFTTAGIFIAAIEKRLEAVDMEKLATRPLKEEWGGGDG